MTRWTQEQLDEYRGNLSRIIRAAKRLPDLPDLPDEGPESRLQARIEAFCREWGRPCVSFRKSIRAKGFIKPGWTDCIIALPGPRTLWLELKARGGRRSKEQEAFALCLLALKHEYHEVRSFKRFLEIVEARHEKG